MDRQVPQLSKVSFLLFSTVVVVSVLAYGTVHQPVIALFYAAVVLLVLLLSADALINKSTRVSTSLIQLPLLLLGVYGIMQIIPFGISTGSVSGLTYPRTISIEPFATESSAIHIFALSAFLAIALAVIDSEKRLRRIVTVLIIFGSAYAFFSILQSVLSPGKIYGIYEPDIATPFGSFVNRHNFAAIMEMIVCIPLALVFTGAVERDKRLLYWVAAALMGTALLLSGSRGGLAAMFAGIFFLAFLT